jgi:hypothetical protein
MTHPFELPVVLTSLLRVRQHTEGVLHLQELRLRIGLQQHDVKAEKWQAATTYRLSKQGTGANSRQVHPALAKHAMVECRDMYSYTDM